MSDDDKLFARLAPLFVQSLIARNVGRLGAQNGHRVGQRRER